MEHGIKFRYCSRSHPNVLEAYIDSDWAGFSLTTKSTTGCVITLNFSPVIWKCVGQTVVAISSADAEYVAM